MKLEEIKNEANWVLVKLSGSLDMVTVGQVETKFLVLTAASRKNAIVDMSELDFIASLGMGMLLGGNKAVQRKGMKMVLLNPQPFVEEALNVARLTSQLRIVRSEEEALRVFAASGGT